MQTPARLNDAMIAKSDLPEIARIDANSRPADDREHRDDGEDAEDDGGSTPGADDEGRSLSDGAFGFHGDHPSENPQGGGSAPAPGGSNGSGTGGGSNGGSPATCSGSSDSGGVRDGFESPGNGQSSPVDPQPNPTFSATGNSSSAASLPGNSLPSLAVGNPIHVATGNKYQAEIDLPALPGRLGLVLSRHYNSEAAMQMGVFGAGWRHAFEARVLADQQSTIRLIQADGRVISFSNASRLDNGIDRYRASRASDGALFVQPNKAYKWRWLDGRELAFDAAGRLTTITQGRERVQLVYENGRLIRVTDPQLRSLTLTYYANGRISRITGPAGFAARYRYDSTGNLAEAAYSDGTARIYRYDTAALPHHLTSIAARSAPVREFGGRDQQVEIAAWTYDVKGRAISSTHPDNAGKMSLQYGAGYTDVTDAFGRISRYEYEWTDDTARVTAVRGPGCGTCGLGDVRYGYGDRFVITDIHIAHQPSLHYRYDAQSRVEEMERTDLEGNHEWLMRFHYEADSSLPARIERPSVNPRGVHITRIAFDTNNNPSRVTESGYSLSNSGAYAPIERSVQLKFDRNSRLLAIDGARDEVSDITSVQYDSLGRLTEWRTPDGRVIRVLKVDQAGRISAVQSGTRSPLHFEYDSRGRLLSMRQRTGNVDRQLQYEYDNVGRLIAVVDDNGHRRRLRYDVANRLNDLSFEGPVHEHHVYAPDNLPVRSSLLTATGRALRSLYFAYDARRRLTETRDGDGPPLQQIRYLDDDDRPDIILDPLGAETRLAYDSLGRLNGVRAPDGGETQFEFDRLQQLTAVTAPNGAHTRYRYDDFGRRVEEISPDRGRLRYEYDSSGNLIRKIDARDLVTRYEYDAADRLVRIQQREGTTRIRYEGATLLSISGPGGSEHRKYDEDGHLIEHSRHINGHEFTTGYQYDASGKLIAKRMPSGERLLYTYNRRGELIGIRTQRWFRTQLLLGTDDPDSSSPPIDANMLGDVKFGNGLVTRTRLDLESGAIAYRATDGITRFTYHRDHAGRITGIDFPGRTNNYSYDAVGRLTSARSPGEQLTYEYDTNGNRVSSTRSTAKGTTRTSLLYEKNSNRLRSITSSDDSQRTEYKYDASGNPLSAGPWRYEYDTSGRLRKLYHKGTLRAEYVYNAQGERVQKNVYANGKRERTFFLYENHQLVAEANERGRVTREYLYLGHDPVTLMDDGRIFWIHTDQLGAPWALTSKEQKMVWSTTRQPFGTLHESIDGKHTGYRFNHGLPGQFEDEESGLFYNLARNYDPKTGRYLESDPLGVVAGENTFAYVSNNPLSSIDPFGLYEQDVHYYMPFFLAITAGFTPDSARRIALSTAFVDVNPFTRPADPTNNWTTVASMRENQPQLLKYHFVLSDFNTGSTIDRYDNANIRLPYSQPSEQLATMLSYATSTPTTMSGRPACNPHNIQLQFFGEFIHAFEDTFSHRDEEDRPFDAVRHGAGLGHGLSGYQPDYTYNSEEWSTRETRSFAMELDTRDLMRRSSWADPNRSTSAEQLDLLYRVLRDFNAIEENEHGIPGSDWTESQKVARLNRGLIELGYTEIDLANPTFRFDPQAAFRIRSEAFSDLDSKHYSGAILETGRSD
ncbi:MAG TPA: DUF6765 family protein [Steroidobacteraceae bacterium]|nr:DUF6765 family protein [Steroidobacteraceae bacterium]